MANKPVFRPCGWCGAPQTAREDRQHFAVCEKRGQTAKQFVAARISEVVSQFDITMHYVNQAVAAERERCARIAEAEAANSHTEPENNGYKSACEVIAGKIRSGE